MALTSWIAASETLKSKAQNAMLWAKGTGTSDIYALEVDPVTGGLPVVVTERVLEFKDGVTFNYSVDGPVTNGAWVEILSATSADIYQLSLFDGSGYTTEIGAGGAGSEQRILLSPPGGLPSNLSLYIPAGTRLSVRSVFQPSISSNSDLVMNLLG